MTPRSLEETTGRSLISDYGNYKSYDKVYPVLSDRNMGENEYLEDSHVAENLYKFIDTLPAESQERDEVQAIINTYPVNKQKMTIAEYGQEMQKDLNDAQRKQLRRYEEHKIHQTHKYAVNKPTADENEDIRRDWFETAPEDTYNFTGIPKTIDPWNS